MGAPLSLGVGAGPAGTAPAGTGSRAHQALGDTGPRLPWTPTPPGPIPPAMAPGDAELCPA